MRGRVAETMWPGKLLGFSEEIIRVNKAKIWKCSQVMVSAATNDLMGRWPFGQAYCNFWIRLAETKIHESFCFETGYEAQ